MQLSQGGICMRFAVRCAAAALAVVWVTGCGGNSTGSHTTKSPYTAKIAWPQRSRDVTAPSSALSAKIEVENADGRNGSVVWLANRNSDGAAHTQAYTSQGIGTNGNHHIVITFFSAADGGGSVVGSASFTEKIAGNGAITSTVTVQSKVATVEVPSNQVVMAPGTKALDVVAKDADANVIALQPGAAFFEVKSGSDFISIEDGLAKGLSQGAATIVARVDGVLSTEAAVSVHGSAHYLELGTIRTGAGAPKLNGVSSDGSTLVGYAFINSSSDFGEKPFRWTESGGYQELQIGLTSPNKGIALRSNRDGSVVVGYTPGDKTMAWVWRNGTVTHINPIVISNYTVATDVSDDGKVIVGVVRLTYGERALRWQGVNTWGLLFDGEDVDRSAATAVSADGTVVVGVKSLKSSPEVYHVVMQTGDSPPTEVPFPGGVSSMYAFGCSSDGRVVVGAATMSSGGSTHPFMWSSATGTVVFPQTGVAMSSNKDGSLIMGNDGAKSFVWTKEDGYLGLPAFALSHLGLRINKEPKLGSLASDNGLALAGGLEPFEEFYEKPWVFLPGYRQ